MERYVIELSFSKIFIEANRLGEDISVSVSGGERPHIGCVVLSVPRPSLTGDGSTSCTSSVINVTGHKDEMICRSLADVFCKKYHCTVAVFGGFHMDHMTKEQIRELQQKVGEFFKDMGCTEK